MFKNIFLFLLVFFSVVVFAKDSSKNTSLGAPFLKDMSKEEKKKRHKFARTYIGADHNFFLNTGSSAFFDKDGDEISYNITPGYLPSINIGGTHFWGYTDFYVSINTKYIHYKNNDPVKTSPFYGVWTGARLYPWRLANNTIRPFIGYKIAPIRFYQDKHDNSDRYYSQQNQLKSAFDAGIGFRNDFLYLYLSYNYIVDNSFKDVYISRDKKVETTLPNQFITLGVNYMFEVTKDLVEGETFAAVDAEMEDTIADGFFIGAGPSSIFATPYPEDESYTKEYHPYVGDNSLGAIFPEIAIGYHLFNIDVLFTLGYRFYNSVRRGQGFEISTGRQSLAFEVSKIFFDFYGFSPYLGVGVASEWIHFKEKDGDASISDEKKQFFTPSFLYGWDIRPARKGDFWILRTNLRWTPWLQYKKDNKKYFMSNVEFNFIELIIYPSKLMNHLQKDKNK